MTEQTHKGHVGRYMLGMAFFVIILYLWACNKPKELPENLVAQVNDQYLLNSQLSYRVPPGLDHDVALALKKSIISDWVETEALYQEARTEGMALNEKERFFVNEYAKALLVQRYLDQRLDRDYKIPQKEIENYYRDHKKEFVRTEDEVHLIHVFIEQKDPAIFKEIRQSENLLPIIHKYYFDKKTTRERPNGDLGYLPVSALKKEYVRVLKRMKTGDISSPIKMHDGYHFFQLMDWQKEGSTRDLDLVRNDIILRLKREHRLDEKARLVKTAKEKVQIQTYLSKIQD